MAMFVLHAANHARNLVEGTEGGRPVRDRQTGVIAGDQGSGDDQDESGAGGEDGEAMQSAMVRDFDAFQDCPLGNARSPRLVLFPKRTSLTERESTRG
jgi:hypothetical protein